MPDLTLIPTADPIPARILTGTNTCSPNPSEPKKLLGILHRHDPKQEHTTGVPECRFPVRRLVRGSRTKARQRRTDGSGHLGGVVNADLCASHRQTAPGGDQDAVRLAGGGPDVIFLFISATLSRIVMKRKS